MGRRVKEEPIIHKNRIAQEAIKLFSKKGIVNTSMDEIAGEAGYSKATLYVYFRNKEDIVGFIALKSMTELRDTILKALNNEETLEKKFFSLCQALVSYQEDYPGFFDRSLNYIGIDTDNEGNSVLNQAYRAGEEINSAIIEYYNKGVQEGTFKQVDNPLEIIFQIWGMISGLIKIAKEKEEYIGLSLGKSRDEFLLDGFTKIFYMIKI